MPTTCLAALIKRLRGIWERYRLRAEAAQNRRDDGHGRVYAWGQVTKETHPAQGHRRSTKETRASVRIAGSRWRQPRAQDYRLQQRRCRRSDSGTGHTRLATEKWVMERMQKNNTCFCKQRKEAALCNLPLWNCCHTQRNSPKESFHTTQP